MSGIVDLLAGSYMLGWAQNQALPTNATPTPFPTLNGICGEDGGGMGLAPGWFVTIGGGTGQGKSLLAQNLALHAMRQGQKVGFLSLEMSHASLATRFYGMATGTPVKSLERGRFDYDAFDRAWASICNTQDARPNAGFLVNSEPIGEIQEVADMADEMRSLGCGLLVLDYLQLVSVGDEENIYRQVTEVAGMMRRFAHKEGVTVLALSQYNTPTGRDTSQQPTMYGLMGGGTIANNGDLVVLLDHSRYERDASNKSIARTFLLVAKNRHGDQGIEIPILWDYRTLTVREGLEDEIREWPE